MNESSAVTSFEGDLAGLCRTRLTNILPFPYLSPSQFNLDSCRKCLSYLKIRNSTEASSVDVDPSDEEQLNLFCEMGGVSEKNCFKWKQCCTNAVACCKEQLVSEAHSATRDNDNTCPQTWDGFSCIATTAAGTAAKVMCPDFLFNGNLEVVTHKQCTENGTWYVAENGREHTGYDFCGEEEQRWDYQLMVVKVVCEIISVLTLCASIFLFLYCRKLYRNSEIAAKYKIHTYTFVAMLLYAANCLLSETAFYLIPSVRQDWDIDNFSSSCAAISMLTRFSMNFSYSAMSVEAFFSHWNVVFALHRLRTFLQPYMVMLVGFVVPLLANGVYIAIRLSLGSELLETDRCWIYPFPPYEWIIYSLNIFCLALNFILLINLFRIIFKMAIDITGFRREKALYTVIRRADFRAMTIFAVIFGAPQFLIIFSPPYQGLMYKFYFVVSNATQMLQGAIASIALCFLSTEVHHAWAATPLGRFFSRRRMSHQDESTNVELLLNATTEHRNM